MAERSGTPEIEAVVTSIRQLVADELRPASAARHGNAAPRLVLTPALRVDVEPDPHASDPAAARILAARLAGLELLLDAQGETFEADTGDAKAIAAIADVAGPTAEPAVISTPEADEAATADKPAADDDVPALIDTAVLRAIIRDVLREELQGELGERVTRNLRKMVRTELGRALTLRGQG